MTKRVTIGQIGCGYWGPNLLRILAAHTDFQLVAVAEGAEKRRAFISSRYPDIPVRDDAAKIIADPNVAAIVIATPADTHFRIAREALLAGKHVLVEKPLATTLAQAAELTALAGKQGVVLMAGHTFLYHDAVLELRRLMSKDSLGQTFYMHSQRLNLGQLRSDVNAWWNLAPHDLSIFLYLMDGRMPKTISASGTAHLQPKVEDVVMASLEWDDGVRGFVHVSWLDPFKVRRMTVVGSQRMIVYDDVSDHKITILEKGFNRVPRLGERMDFDNPQDFRFEPRQGDVHMPHIAVREPLQVEIAHFLECITLGKEPLTGGRHACDVVSLLEAGHQSLKAGGHPVTLGPSHC